MENDIMIVGFGFVGKSIYQNLTGHSDNTKGAKMVPVADRADGRMRLAAQLDGTIIVDPILGSTIEDYKGAKVSAIFLALPTPSSDDGTIDCSLVTNVINYIENNLTYDIIVLKSTVTPDVVGFLCQNDKIIYNPEFLTERNAQEDFAKAQFHIIGCRSKVNAHYLEHLYNTRFELTGYARYLHVSPEAASFIKYGVNSFLATKVAWFNEFYDTIQAAGLDQRSYDAIVEAMKYDQRIGITHMQVPGWDSRRGFGGACFPKDIPAFLHYSRAQTGQYPPILQSAWNYNTQLRNSEPLLDREVEQKIVYQEMED